MSKLERQRQDKEREAYRREEIERQERRKREDVERARLRKADEVRHRDVEIIAMQKAKKEKELEEIGKKSLQYLEEIENKNKVKQKPEQK